MRKVEKSFVDYLNLNLFELFSASIISSFFQKQLKTFLLTWCKFSFNFQQNLFKILQLILEIYSFFKLIIILKKNSVILKICYKRF